LHDSAGQTLAFLALTVAQLLEACKNSSKTAKLARQTEESIRQLDREILPCSDESGLASALGMYIEGLRGHTDRPQDPQKQRMRHSRCVLPMQTVWVRGFSRNQSK